MTGEVTRSEFDQLRQDLVNIIARIDTKLVSPQAHLPSRSGRGTPSPC